MECEICGKEDADIFALIEGAKLRVCEACARGGKILYVDNESGALPKVGDSQPHGKSHESSHTMDKEEFDLVDSYGTVIKSARENLGISLAVLGERIAEKESFLERIEKESAKPDDLLARKIEKELGIAILEKAESQPFQTSGRPGKDITLGDVIEIVRKKKK